MMYDEWPFFCSGWIVASIIWICWVFDFFIQRRKIQWLKRELARLTAIHCEWPSGEGSVEYDLSAPLLSDKRCPDCHANIWAVNNRCSFCGKEVK